MKQNTFSKIEKLCSFTHIQQLFEQGKIIKEFPLKLVYLPIKTDCKTPIKVLISVPKRGIKKATQRNYIKRIIRESYRLQKLSFNVKENHQYAFAFIYTSRSLTNYEVVFKAINDLANQWNSLSEE